MPTSVIITLIICITIVAICAMDNKKNNKGDKK